MNDAFVKKWSDAYYTRYDEENYTQILEQKRFSKEDIDTLLSWKSPFFREDVRARLKRNLDEMNLLKVRGTEEEINKFVRKFYPYYPQSAIVLGTFIKHIIQPKIYPIYDQFVHRAFHLLTKRQEGDCLETCYEDYRRFFIESRDEMKCSDKQLDEALWAYGKYA